MTPPTTNRRTTVYTPDVDEREGGRGPFWRRVLHPNEILAWCALLAAAATFLGIRFITVKELDARVTAVEHEIDGISTQQNFTNYLLCDEKRLRDPGSVPQGCLSILIKGVK
jgi:hypothetical protein